MSTVEGFRLARRRFTISPAFEKILSDGTEVAGMPRYLSAIPRVFGTLHRSTSTMPMDWC